MKSVPWVDWLPGVLGQDQMVALAQAGHILPFESDDMDYSSFDLHLSSDVYEITGGAIKPNGQTYMNVIRPFISRVDPERASHPGTFVLQPRKTYVVQLKEQLVNLGNSSIYGQATAKSSVGRVDVLARLVVDGMRGYEEFIPQHLGRGSGHLYLEITSMTFPVRIKEGTKLSQLRLFYGRPANSEIRGAELLRTVLRPDGGVGWSPEEANSECYLSVNLDNDNVCGVSAAAFNASDAQGGEPINLWTTEPKTGRRFPPIGKNAWR